MLPPTCTTPFEWCYTGNGYGSSANIIVRDVDCDGDGVADLLCEEVGPDPLAGGSHARYLLASTPGCGMHPACQELGGSCASCPAVPLRLPQSCPLPPPPQPLAPGAQCLMFIGDSITAGLGRESRWGGWRPVLWRRLLDAGVSFEFTGSTSDYKCSDDVDLYRNRRFPPLHEAYPGARTDQVKTVVQSAVALDRYGCQPSCVTLHRAFVLILRTAASEPNYHCARLTPPKHAFCS